MVRKSEHGSERGAALLAVLAMVILLASFASIGLARLKAATGQVEDARSRQQAQLLAESGAAAARFMVSQIQTIADPTERQKPVTIRLDTGTIILHFENGANCFNLNSLVPPPAAPGMPRKAAESRPGDLAALLTATGISQMEAGQLAQATVDHLASSGIFWVDGSEWTTIKGVSTAHWQAAGQLLCALPGHEATALDINTLTAADAPLLAAFGVPVDEARRLLSRPPEGGWESVGSFWNMTSAGKPPQTMGAQLLGTKSRWVKVRIEVQTDEVQLERTLLLDTVPQPAKLVATSWGAIRIAPPHAKEARG